MVHKLKSVEKLKTPFQRLEYIRNILKLSRQDVEAKYGLSQDTLKTWEKGITALKDKNLDRCIEIYRGEGLVVQKNWILTGEGLDPKIHADLSGFFEEIKNNQDNELLDSDEILMLKEAEYFKSIAPNSIVMVVTTNEMMPVYSVGDYIGGRLLFENELQTAIGKDCIIKVHQSGQFFRRLVRNATNDGYNLVCINPNWGGTLEPVLYDVDVEAVAPIIWHRKPNEK